MGLQYVVVAAFLLYALAYLGRYAWRTFKGKSTGCGCGHENQCPRSQPPKSR